MSDADLDEVLLMEYASHAHPWSRGNFLDSIAAGHWAYCMREANEEPKTIWAYCILLPAVDDLHLLNITAYYPLESSTGQREDALVMTKTLKQHANLYEH